MRWSSGCARATSPSSFPGKRSHASLVYRVVAARAVRDQLRGAPPQLQGYAAGIVAVFASGRGFLRYWALEDQHVIVLLDLTWL